MAQGFSEERIPPFSSPFLPSLSNQIGGGGENFSGESYNLFRTHLRPTIEEGNSKLNSYRSVGWFDPCCFFLVPASFLRGSKRVGMKYFFPGCLLLPGVKNNAVPNSDSVFHLCACLHLPIFFQSALFCDRVGPLTEPVAASALNRSAGQG